MIDKIDPSQIQDFVENTLPKQSGSAKADSSEETDASLQAKYASIIAEAQNQQADSSAVQRAKELLMNGQLESPENIRKTAENIITYGI
ncbi:hypothetical protein ACFL1G_07005 [Planctomycetota bacterium]